jgi:hypothetical protein
MSLRLSTPSMANAMLDLILQIIGEFLIQIIGEILVELGFHSLAEPFRTPPNPWLAVIGYGVFGAIAGGLSLIFFPTYLTSTKAWRIANLVITPIAVGLCMAALGAWRTKRGQLVFRIDRFSYGYLFALSLAVIRFNFAK